MTRYAALVPSETGLGRTVSVILTLIALLLLNQSANAEPVHRCSGAATEQAGKLLVFHFGEDQRIEIDKSVKKLAAIRNPANRKQLLDVLEVWGYIHKGQYRMRFTYARLAEGCVLMGQEIMEFADL